jgi:hypothetical protein
LVPETPRLDAVDFTRVPFIGSTPTIGGLVLLKYDDVYHIAVVTGFTNDGFRVFEGNYKPCEITRRTIGWNDERIVKFLYFG